ncbi:MAG: carboxypeptidase regulatory-like domain-containing protein, partial [Planctomycetes bacterium]|nr:carboxypeptidase regulatory-like domain-containing protein [Planctomycetota bacterium]
AQRLGRLQVTVRVHLFRGLRELRRRLPPSLLPLLIAMLWPSRVAHSATGVWRAVPVLTAAAVVGVALVALVSRASEEAPPLAPSAERRAKLTRGESSDAESVANESAEVRRSRERALDAGSTFAVRLVDGSGRGLAHAAIIVEPAGGEPGLALRRRELTDVEGRVRFASLPWSVLRVSSDRGHAQEARIDESELTLRASGERLRGRVVDEHGNGVAGASIWLAPPRTSPSAGGVVSSSDARGNFELEAVAPGSLVAALAPRGVSRLATWPGREELRLELAPACELRGCVRDAAGRPLAEVQVAVGSAPEHADEGFPDALVLASVPSQIVRTDASGRFGPLWLPPGEQLVHARHAGHRAACAVVALQLETPNDCELVLDAATRCAGRIVDDAGHPIAFAEIVYRGADRHQRVDLRSGPTGEFAFDLPSADEASLCVRAPGFEPRRFAIEAPRAALPRELVLSRSTWIEGRLERSDGTALGGWSVRWIVPSSSALISGEQVVRADTAGSFRLARRAGTPRCSVRAPFDPLWHPLAPDAIENEGDRLRLRVADEFLPTAALRGRCIGVRGEPCADARIYLRRGAGIAWESARTDLDGRFAVAALAPGTYEVFAESTTPELAALRAEGLDVLPHAEIDLELAPAATGWLRYALRWPDGTEPESGLITVVSEDPARRVCARTQTSGTQRLPVGRYRFHALGEAFAWIDGVPFRIEEDCTTELALEVERAQRTTIGLRGLDALGAGVRRLELFRGAEERPCGSFTLLADAHPSITACLPHGAYRLCVRSTESSTFFCGELELRPERPPYAAVNVTWSSRDDGAGH